MRQASLLVVLVLSLPASAQKEEKNPTDAKFVTLATAGDLADIELGKLAKEKGQLKEVRQLGDRLMIDHTKLAQDLIVLAKKKGMRPATEMDALHQNVYLELMKAKGRDFDRKYVAAMVHAHKQAVTIFETQAARSADADLKTYAQQNLPTIRNHLKMAQTLQDQLAQER